MLGHGMAWLMDRDLFGGARIEEPARIKISGAVHVHVTPGAVCVGAAAAGAAGGHDTVLCVLC